MAMIQLSYQCITRKGNITTKRKMVKAKRLERAIQKLMATGKVISTLAMKRTCGPSRKV